MKYRLFFVFGLFFLLGYSQNPTDPTNEFEIEKVPVFPGCESLETNESLKNCMMRKISEHIAKNFDTGFAGKLGLKGRQRIDVLFTVNKIGKVTNIQAKGPHRKLEKEARKVMETLPRLIPGEQHGEPVGILYLLPIIFEIE